MLGNSVMYYINKLAERKKKSHYWVGQDGLVDKVLTVQIESHSGKS